MSAQLTDRELLEFAAKAAAINHVSYDGVDYDGSQGLILVDENGRHMNAWNPISDDGDALRLASEMNMVLDINGPHVSAGDGGSISVTEESFTMEKRMPAIRMSIVRVAAEIWIRAQ